MRHSPERPPFARTIRQAAKELRVQRIVIRQLISLGQVPCFMVDGRVYVDTMIVRAYLDRHR